MKNQLFAKGEYLWNGNYIPVVQDGLEEKP